MAMFYTHILLGEEWVHDQEGIDRPDLETVRREALKGVREMLAADVCKGTLNLDGEITIDDENGSQVFRLSFSEAVVVTGL